MHCHLHRGDWRFLQIFDCTKGLDYICSRTATHIHTHTHTLHTHTHTHTHIHTHTHTHFAKTLVFIFGVVLFSSVLHFLSSLTTTDTTMIDAADGYGTGSEKAQTPSFARRPP